MSDAGADLFTRCRGLGVEDNLALYAELLGDSDAQARHAAALPALALRDKARAGEVDRRFLPVLVIALVDAPNLAAFTHLAKALASFGHEAECAAPYVIDRLQGLAVTNDRRFWVLDAGLWTLGYLGGELAKAFLLGLQAERPSLVLRSKSVYQGELDDERREGLHQASLVGALSLLQRTDAGGWLDKRTALMPSAPDGGAKRLAPWMIR